MSEYSNSTGSCVCGEIAYVAKNIKPIWYCHCEQCRRMTGHYMAASQVHLEDIDIKGEPKWYYVNERSRHGFCPNCGAQMFWRNDENDTISITGGSLNNTEGLLNKGHIFVAEKAAYYDLPKHEGQSDAWPDDE